MATARTSWPFAAGIENPGEPTSAGRSSASNDLINYRQHLVSVERLRPATVNRRLQALRRFCRWARDGKILKADPGETIKSVRVTKRGRPQGLEEPEVHALLRVAGESRYGHARRNYAVVQFLLQTGLRISEAAALCLADLKLRERTGSVRVRQGKGRKEREVPLNASARRALRTYLEPRGALPPEAPLFLSGRGGPMAVRLDPEPDRATGSPGQDHPRSGLAPHAPAYLRVALPATEPREARGAGQPAGPRVARHHRPLHPALDRRPGGGPGAEPPQCLRLKRS